MKIEDEIIRMAKERAVSDHVISALLDHYEFVTSNPAYESYIVRRKVLDGWNKDLIENDISILNPKGSDGKSIEKRDKEIERIQRYLDNQIETVRDTESLRKMLNDQEVESAEKVIASGPDRAF